MLTRLDKDEWMVQEPQQVSDRWSEFDEILDFFRSDVSDAISPLQNFIQRCPNHIDAIHHLAMCHYETGNLLEAILLEKSAVEKVVSNENKKVDLTEVKLSWELLENRPFLRALHALGIFQFDYGDWVQAEKSLKQLLSLNFNDNLGGRYVLTKLAFEINKPDMVLSLASQFPDDVLPELTFGKALAHIQLEDKDLARTALDIAMSIHPKVADLLIQPIVEAEDLSSGYIVMGGEDQAFAYRQDYLKFWRATPLAIPLLTTVYENNNGQPL